MTTNFSINISDAMPRPWVPPVTSENDDAPRVPAVQATMSEAETAAAELRFKQDAIERLKRRDPATGITLLDGLERFFDDGTFWARKNDGLHGDRCLIGGILEANRVYGLRSCEPAFYYLGQAINPHGGIGTPAALAEWNARCEQFAKLRAVIKKARDLARADQDRLREAEASMPVVEVAPARRRWWQFGA